MKLVVAIDGEQGANSALDYMVKEQYAGDTEVHLIHVLVDGFADVGVEGIPDRAAEEICEEQSVLKNMAQGLKDKLNIVASTEIVKGEVADVIARTCKQYGAEAVLVPSHARHGFSRLWFGSVADEIVDAAPCTVVVLKMPVR